MFRKLFLLLFFTAMMAHASEYRQVDQQVRNYPYFRSLEHLSIRIMNDFESDEERVRAAFIWIIHNMDYGRSFDVIFQTDKHFPYYSEMGRRYQLRQLELEKIDQSFRDRLGVCLDYSLLLKELCNMFKIPSEIIIGVTKTGIHDFKGKPLLKNHTWNAVQIDGKWKLADPTWASSELNRNLVQYFGHYIEQFFFTDPADLIKSHLPANPAWQLLENPVDDSAFATAPNFMPEYFVQDVKLSPKTKGVISLAKYNEYLIMFDRLSGAKNMHYSIDGSLNLKKMEIKKAKDQPYVSIIKLKKRLKKKYQSLTVFMDYRPILKFRIEN